MSHFTSRAMAMAPSSPMRFELMSSAVTGSPLVLALPAMMPISTSVARGPIPHPLRLSVLGLHLALIRFSKRCSCSPVDVTCATHATRHHDSVLDATHTRYDIDRSRHRWCGCVRASDSRQWASGDVC